MLHMQDTQTAAVNDRADTPDRSWTIRELSSHYDITPRTLRFYEDKGLIAPGRAGGNRVYGPRDRARLEQILRAKRLGFSLDDIADFQHVIEGKILDRSELLKRRKAYLHMIEQLAEQRRDIDIVTKGLARTAAGIQAFVDDPARDAAILNYAEAYAAAFAPHMDDDFSEETAGFPGSL